MPAVCLRDTLVCMKSPIAALSPDTDRPEDILEGVAADAWQAYNAMESTKRRHYQLLEILENKKKNYALAPTEKEQRRLAGLLKDHDQQVSRFTAASLALKQADSAAHLALFVYIGEISDSAEMSPSQH